MFERLWFKVLISIEMKLVLLSVNDIDCSEIQFEVKDDVKIYTIYL